MFKMLAPTVLSQKRRQNKNNLKNLRVTLDFAVNQ